MAACNRVEERKASTGCITVSDWKCTRNSYGIPAEDLGKADGMEKRIAQLDKVFLRDDKDKAYEAYKNFDVFKITENMKISDYILEFDKPYNKAKKYEMALPEAIIAFKILDNAGLSSQEKQLDLTACTDLQYKSMKSALQRIFGENSSSYSDVKTDSQIITVKQEPGFCTQNKKINSKSS